MSRNKTLSVIAISSLLAAGAAFAQSGGASGQAAGEAAAQAATKDAQVGTSASTSTSADAGADVSQLRERIEKKSERTSAQVRAKAETRLDAAAQGVEKTAAGQGDEKVAGRLAAEFGTTTQAMLDEKQALGASWGNLMIAHTLASNASTDVTVEQLMQMKSDGMGWGKIAAGLGLNLGSVVSSVGAEGRVANGLTKPDGKVAVIHGEGARAGADAHGSVHAGLGADHAHAGLGAGVGAGIKIGH